MRVLVVIVNYNGGALVESAVASALQQTHGNGVVVEVCVVDNASTDDSLSRLKRFDKRIHLLPSASNLGFAAGNNLAFSTFPDFDAYALLNPDALAAPDWVARMVDEARLHPTWGIISPKILQAGASDVWDNAGHRMFLDGSVRGRGRLMKDIGQFDDLGEIFIASGCAVMLRAEAVQQAHGFDPMFFCYCDDVELSLRLQWLGFTGHFAPKARVEHAFSAAQGALFSPFKVYHVERNRHWVVLKCFPVALWPVAAGSMVLRYSAGAVSTFWAKRGPGANFVANEGSQALMRTLLRAHRDALRGAPKVLASRRYLRHGRRLSTLDFLRRFARHYLPLRDLLTLQ